MLEHPILEGLFFFSSPIYIDSLTDLRHSAVGKLEMLDLPSLNTEIQRLREIEMSRVDLTVKTKASTLGRSRKYSHHYREKQTSEKNPNIFEELCDCSLF